MRLNNRTLTNPFIYQGYESPKYFCDREVETKTLLSHLKNYLSSKNRKDRTDKDMFEGHTWYIQCIMNRLYETNTNVESIEQVNAAILSILAGREPQFESLSQFFTNNQFSLLKAIAKEGIVAQPTAGRFIKSHNLSGASSTNAALKVLEDKELVYRKPEGYIIYDRFMDLWLKRL